MKIDIADLEFAEARTFFLSARSPRPIALVSTVGENGVLNVAPFANYGQLSIKPAIVHVGIARRAGLRKDTIKNIQFSEDFVINVVTETLVEQIVQCAVAYPGEINEFEETGLTALNSELVKSPRVAESPISMECILKQIMEFGESPSSTEVALGEVLRVHVRDDLWVDGKLDISNYKPLGRVGLNGYCRLADTFEMKVPNL